jgi:PAS domain S-box-containing protein
MGWGFFMNPKNSKKSSVREDKIHSNKIYRMIFESNTFFNILIGLDGKFIDVNNYYADFVGIPRDELIGSTFFEVDVYAEGEDPGKYEQQFSIFLAGIKTGGSEVKLRTPRGSRWVELHPTLLKDDNGNLAVYVTGQDITDRKNTENKDNFQANILKNLKEAVIITDLDGKITYWNKIAETLFGFTKNEVTGKSIEKIFTNINEKSLSKLKAQLERGKDISSEYYCPRKDNTLIYVDMNISSVLDYKGDNIGFIFVCKDMTYSKNVEKELKAYSHEREMLFGEINKRMENYFAMLSNLLEVYSSVMTNQKNLEYLKDNHNRMKSMLLLNNLLSKSDDFAIINFSKFIKRLIWHLKVSYNLKHNVILNIKMDSIMLDIDQAVPCGLIANELLSLAFKKKYSNVNGEIEFTFNVDKNGNYIMHVLDNGVVKASSNNEISQSLVKNLVNQIDGNITISEDGLSDYKVSWTSSDY